MPAELFGGEGIVSEVEAQAETYAQQKQNLRAYKREILLALMVVTLFLMFVTMWSALFLSKQVTVPIQGLAEATRSTELVRAMTEVQGAMTDLIAHIAHPPQVLDSSNAQHRRLLAALREGDDARAARVMTEHLHATEHILAGLMPNA